MDGRTGRNVVKKEVTICDKCKREIPEGEKYVNRIKVVYHTGAGVVYEDICRDCTYQQINKNFWRNEVRTP